jgi:hypothetical protein
MRINLQVPIHQRGIARRRGATWDKSRRVFYVEHVEDLRPFLRWIPSALEVRTHAAA